MGKFANKVVEQAKAWIGKKESNNSHREIIDVYNSHKPLARGYKVKYTDAWCSTFVSAVAIKLGYTDIIPTECGCEKHIQLFKKIGAWVENDNRTPKAGDVIFYDWDDSGSGDNKGNSDHVGIVEKVSNGTITVIEGNMNNSVGRRKIAVNGKYIRGYGVPKYDVVETVENKVENSKETTATTKTETTKNKKATEPAKAFDSSLAGTYKVTAKSGLNVRNGAGTNKSIMVAIPKGTEVKNYGYYTAVSSVKWLYIQFTYKDTTYTGFATSQYLKK